jgi:hypothetical protein
MNHEIDKNMVILHIENYVISQKEEEDEFYDGFILCNFEEDHVIMCDIYEEVNDVVALLPSYTNVENIEQNKPNAIMSSSTRFIDCVFKEEDTKICETQQQTCVEILDETENAFQEQEVKEIGMETMTSSSSTSSLDTEEEEELENQLMYYKTSIEKFECEIKLYEKMLSGLIYKNTSLYKYKFIFVNNNTYTSIIRKIETLTLNKKMYEKTLEDILKLQRNDKITNI